MFNTWKSNPNDEDTSDYILPENRTETALVRGSRKREWTHAEVLNSLGPLFNNNSYYMVSHQVIPIIAPINAQDNQSNPKITFGKNLKFFCIEIQSFFKSHLLSGLIILKIIWKCIKSNVT